MYSNLNIATSGSKQRRLTSKRALVTQASLVASRQTPDPASVNPQYRPGETEGSGVAGVVAFQFSESILQPRASNLIDPVALASEIFPETVYPPSAIEKRPLLDSGYLPENRGSRNSTSVGWQRAMSWRNVTFVIVRPSGRTSNSTRRLGLKPPPR